MTFDAQKIHGKLAYTDLTVASPHAQRFQYREPGDVVEHLMRTKKNKRLVRSPR